MKIIVIKINKPRKSSTACTELRTSFIYITTRRRPLQRITNLGRMNLDISIKLYNMDDLLGQKYIATVKYDFHVTSDGDKQKFQEINTEWTWYYRQL